MKGAVRMNTKAEILVYWIDPWAWDKDMELRQLHQQQDPVDLWLDLVHALGWRVLLLPYDARISGGPCDGGHVVAVETGEGRQFVALPPQAIPALRDELSLADYQALVQATPALETEPVPYLARRRTPR